jgi:hypothetical protein
MFSDFPAHIASRFERLVITLICKKYFMVAVATFLLFRGLINGETWAMFVLAVIGVASWEKLKGAGNEPARYQPKVSKSDATGD